MTDVRFYNRALTTNDVQAIYGVENPGNCTPPPAGLVSWWPAEGNAYDQTGTNNGTWNGSVNYTNGEVGQAFKFDGVSSYVQISNSASLNPPGPFSIEGWIYPTLDGSQKIISKWGDQGVWSDNRSYNLATIPGLGLSFAISDLANEENGTFQTFNSSNGVLTLNAWNHVAATYDSSSGIRCMYVNGAIIASMTNAPVSVYGGIAPLTIGGWARAPGVSQFYFQGLIDEISFYSRALSAGEIQAIFNAGAGGKCDFHYYVPPPRQATASATVVNGFIVGVDMTDEGAGYTNPPAVRLIGGGGTGALASAVISNGMVVAVNVLNPGSGYTNLPVIVVIDPPFIANPMLQLANVSSLSFGGLVVSSNYQLQFFQSQNWVNQGTGFTANTNYYSKVVPGTVGSSDYRLALLPVPTPATAVPQLVNGFVVGATLVSGGSGYITVPAVNIIANVGSNATAVATISGGRVTKITITNAGIGYVNPVTIQIDPPPVSALSPAVMPGMVLNSSGLAPYDNYQIQFRPDFGTAWENLNGELFTPTASTNSQYLFLTNNTGFLRLLYVP
ncbi:MAG TPA: LamG domain-containing protein [Candidatus Acidoferrales bacterium]|nr:LamG domain-containing protein [Candidatus Acidoferrales bacterium]